MKKFCAIIFCFMVLGVCALNCGFLEKLSEIRGAENVSFYCASRVNESDLFLLKMENEITEIKNGFGFVYSAPVTCAKNLFKSLNGCFGFSASFDDEAFEDIIQNVRVLKTEVVEGVQNFYGVVSGLVFFDFLGSQKVNVQVAKTSEGVVVGSPIILGDY